VASQAIGKASDLFLGLLQVTVEAPAHVHAPNRARGGHLPNISMAGLATYARQKMRLVTEEDMIRHFGDPLPGNGLLSLPVAQQDLNFTPVGGDHAMTSDTTLNGRDSSYIGPHGIRVTE
jgi:hypothetical protein